MKKTEFRLELPDLLHFLRETCHDNLHISIRKVKGLLHNDLKPEMTVVLDQLFKTASLHLAHEEKTFFPLLLSERSHTLHSMIHLVDDHFHLSELLDNLFILTNGFNPRHENEVMIFDELKEMERIFRNHIKIENNVLFPMIMNKQRHSG